MVVFLIVVLIIGIIWVAALISMGQGIAKKQAQKILDGTSYKPKELKKALYLLSTAKDNEGKRLYNKLADFADSHK